ncbi:MAG: DUF2189 domain-containing protein [Amaricoccus sp.]|uniref:DUF2189 domain-containing protein n=1 Tax=Amaricoccus sp. TaxID=1872485 RepID=UPI00331582CC
MTDTAPTEISPRPAEITIRSISVDDVYAALSRGWADFRAVPRFGLFFGGVYALVGILIFIQLWVIDQSFWILPLAFAFPLIGPFVAIGLYEVSRRREAGEPLDWSDVLGAVWRQRDGQLPSMAFVVLAGFLVWMWAASLIVILFVGQMDLAVYSDFDSMLDTANGVALVLVGGLVGGAIAAFLFAITAVALPLLLDRDVDYVTAMVTSFRAVTTNPAAMLNWAWIVAGGLFVAMVPLFLGLIVALPVLGHATWHVYRAVIAPK